MTANEISFHLVEAGPSDGVPVFLLHGFPEFWWAWRHQLTPLAQAGFRVIAPDLRGYNLSDAPRGLAAYHIDLLAADVIGLADVLGMERFHLVGHDWGGVIAWQVAARYPERSRRMVILDAPHPDVWAVQAVKHPRQAIRSSYAIFFQLPWLPEIALGAFRYEALRRTLTGSARPDAFETGAVDRYVEAWRRPGHLTAMLNYYRALRRRRPGKSAVVRVPTLVLWGGKDSLLGQHVAEASVERCEDCRLHVLDDATHWLHLEEPERVSGLIIGHLCASHPR
ncbi:alpha/beta fold hydrolase [Sphingomonas sp. ID0503]|uniref:alpha/beta fold hydrolase n=1 Tax=Sphingomonas sp. ID0503 TaxID=3399691 RepID=UPI003AFB099B